MSVTTAGGTSAPSGADEVHVRGAAATDRHAVLAERRPRERRHDGEDHGHKPRRREASTSAKPRGRSERGLGDGNLGRRPPRTRRQTVDVTVVTRAGRARPRARDRFTFALPTPIEPAHDGPRPRASPATPGRASPPLWRLRRPTSITRTRTATSTSSASRSTASGSVKLTIAVFNAARCIGR